MNKIASVEITLNYEYWDSPVNPKNIDEGFEILSKDSLGNEIESNCSELIQELFLPIGVNDLIQYVASHLKVCPSKVKIINAIAWVEVEYSVDYKNMNAVEIASVISKDNEGRTLKIYNDLTCYPSQIFPTGIQTAKAEIIKYVVSKLKPLNVDSNMIQISER